MGSSHNSQTSKDQKEKMGGKKRKIEIEEIEGPAKTVAFSKRKAGLFSKAEELCRLYPITRIAILVPPFAEKSHVPFYTFGHSSEDKVVNTFLENPENHGSEFWFWWEDERFDTMEDLDELHEARDSILTILNKARRRLADLEKINHHHQQEEEDSKDLVKSNQRDASLVNHHHHHHHKEESKDLVESNQGDHHHQEEEEKVLEICKEETKTTGTNYIPELGGPMTMPYYIPKLEFGETSGTANCFFGSDEDDQFPDYFIDIDHF